MAETASKPKEGVDAKARGEVDTSVDVGQAEVQQKMDAITEKGYIGQVTDPTPRENYSAANSAPGNDLPTPETDEELWREARSRSFGDNPKASVNETTVDTHEAAKAKSSAPAQSAKGGDK